MSEVAKKIREELKEKGYNSRKISVKGSYPGYDESVKVTIKDLSINKKEIEEIAKKHKSVDYCEFSGEILAGGNTYVSVEYDWKLIHEAAELKKAEAEEIIKNANGKNYTILRDDKIVVLYVTDNYESYPVIEVLEKVPFADDATKHWLDRKFRYIAHNVPHIAEALVYIEYKMY